MTAAFLHPGSFLLGLEFRKLLPVANDYQLERSFFPLLEVVAEDERNGYSNNCCVDKYTRVSGNQITNEYNKHEKRRPEREESAYFVISIRCEMASYF